MNGRTLMAHINWAAERHPDRLTKTVTVEVTDGRGMVALKVRLYDGHVVIAGDRGIVLRGVKIDGGT